ncbi:DUF5123 domain-containing protein [candidate division KSB1 bacterium]|nr:DUF5123 domain-containing protein [candidate division KSB1 bacterium]
MKSNFRIILILLCLSGLMILPGFAQTIHQVSAGDGTLPAAVKAAADGDIIELVDSGGLYTQSESEKIEIEKKLTIRAPEGLAVKPIVRIIKANSTSGRTFEVLAGGHLTLKGLDLDGRIDDAGTKLVKNIIRSAANVTDANAFHFNLKVENCDLHNTKEALVRVNAYTHSDTVIFRNCFFREANNEGVLLRESTSRGAPIVQFVELTNCTFSRIGREALYHEFSNPVIKINHCTFDAVSYRENKRILYPKDVENVEIKNCIFSNQGSTSEAMRLYGNSTISYCDTFNINKVVLEGNASIGAGMLDVDPLYTDPANYNFILAETSPVLNMADDGLAMGDLRWAPKPVGPTIHFVEAGDRTLRDAILAAKDGDIIELITSGGLYTNSETDKIEITKTVTIRPQSGLAFRPVIKNTNLDASSARLFEIQKGGNLTLIGLDLDGTNPDGSAPHAKNIIRSQDVNVVADSFHFNLKVIGCLLHDSKEAIFKGHANTMGDTIVFNNCILDETSKEGLLLRESTEAGGPKVKYLEVENCTFTKMGREAIYIEFSNPVVRINHCTFDSISYAENKRIIYPRNVTDVEIKNCIFTNQGGTNSTSIELYGNSTISYSDTFNVAGFKLNNNSTVGSGMLGVDPMYSDPANYDYRLAATSPVRGAADDGKAMGDLRWEISPGLVFLTVVIDGKGAVTLDPPGGVYNAETSVKMTAVPDAGWKFVGWEGVMVFPPDNPVATIVMDADKTVKAKFESLAPKVTLQVDTLGLGHVELDPLPVNGKYDQGTIVKLTAVPQPNWHFVEWLGDVTSFDNPISVAIDSNMNVTASFLSDITQFKLTIETNGAGSVQVDPAPFMGTYDSSKAVILTALPAPGYEFTGWTGDLVSEKNPDTIVMGADKMVTANFAEIMFTSHALEIDTTWDLRDAVEFANNNSYIDSLILITSGGLYTSISTSDVAVTAPLTIVAAPALEKKPIITNSDVEKANLDVFRVFDDFTLKGVVVDGGHPRSQGMKYGIRLRHYTDTDSVKKGTDITILDCDFKDFFEAKNPSADGHAVKFDVDIIGGTLHIENSTFTNFGYEAIRISDTEKYATDRALDSLIIRNCTFTNIDAEAVRYYSDLDANTPDAPVIIEHVTFNNTGTRVIYLKNSNGASVRDIIIANSRTSGHGRDGDLMDAQGFGTVVSHIDTFNVKPVAILSGKGGKVDAETIYGIDPQFEDAASLNYTLLPSSHLYGLGHDGEAIGDLNWATNVPTTVALVVVIEGSGKVNVTPSPIGKTYNPGTELTLTAVPDSGWKFVEWTGDLVSTANPAVIKLEVTKNITASFESTTGIEPNSGMPTDYSLEQNHPNPFNPMTTISFALKEPGMTTLKVYDVIGREVATLVNQRMNAGSHQIIFHAPELASGVYFYKIQSGDFMAIKKMILAK